MNVLHSTTLQRVLSCIDSLGLTTGQSRVLFHLQTVSAMFILNVKFVLNDTPDMYIKRTAGLIKQVVQYNRMGNWFQKYVQNMHSWASTVLKDGSLTGD
eukprot:2994225-Heterocapsa_arctica.AAC.1